MKIRQKLILGFTGIALLVGLVSIFVFLQNSRLKAVAQEGVFDSISHLDDVWSLMEAQEHMEIAAKNHLFLGKELEGKRADYYYEKERLQKIYQDYLSRSCEHVKPLLREYDKNIKTYYEKAEEAFALYKQGADLEVIKAKMNEADKYITIAHEDILEPIVEHVHNVHIEPSKENFAKILDRTSLVIATISIIAVFFAIGIGLYIYRTISIPITKLKDATERIGSGDLKTTINILSNDEIGQLSRAFDKMTGDLAKTTTSIDKLNDQITQRKQLEESLRQAQQAAQNANEAKSD
ncbi:HAMP domain-containing protein, partial [bacterium]|nr:HAMP domain-containing protein [bacterium]